MSRGAAAAVAGLALLLTVGAPGMAASPGLSAEEFEAFTAGKTVHFTFEGLPYGSEQFLHGHRTLWHFEGEKTCGWGQWREVEGLICFAYDNAPDEQCWKVTEADGKLRAQQSSGGTALGMTLEMSHADDIALPCPAPSPGI